MRFKLQTIRFVLVAAGAMLSCAAMSQTPAAPAPVGAPSAAPDPVAAYQKFRENLHRDELLRAAQSLAAKPAIAGPVEREGSPATTQAPQPGKFGEEGIRIHGHWVIDVKNPDGTLAGHHDFQNALQPGGAFFLAGMMASEFVPANWMIALTGTTPICASSTNNLCGIIQSQSSQPAQNFCANGAGTCVTGLTTTFNYSTSVSFVLSGSFTATQTGNINQVGSVVGTCFTATSAPFSPQSCVTAGTPSVSGANFFSSTGITAIPVNSGQVVQVTVTFTFS